MARRNFGLSGKNENIAPFHKFTRELQIMKKRHGVKFKPNICHVHSIGSIKMANNDKTIVRPLSIIEDEATARGAVLDV